MQSLSLGSIVKNNLTAPDVPTYNDHTGKQLRAMCCRRWKVVVVFDILL